MASRNRELETLINAKDHKSDMKNSELENTLQANRILNV